MTNHPSEDTKVIWQHFDPLTKDTLVYGSLVTGKFVDVSGYNRVMCVAVRLVGTGSVQEAALYVATSAAGAGATQITATAQGSTEATGLANVSTGTIANPGAGMVVMETVASDLESTLADGRYLGCKMSLATATDEFLLCWVLTEPRTATASLTTTGSN